MAILIQCDVEGCEAVTENSGAPMAMLPQNWHVVEQAVDFGHYGQGVRRFVCPAHPVLTFKPLPALPEPRFIDAQKILGIRQSEPPLAPMTPEEIERLSKGY